MRLLGEILIVALFMDVGMVASATLSTLNKNSSDTYTIDILMSIWLAIYLSGVMDVVKFMQINVNLINIAGDATRFTA